MPFDDLVATMLELNRKLSSVTNIWSYNQAFRVLAVLTRQFQVLINRKGYISLQNCVKKPGLPVYTVQLSSKVTFEFVRNMSCTHFRCILLKRVWTLPWSWAVPCLAHKLRLYTVETFIKETSELKDKEFRSQQIHLNTLLPFKKKSFYITSKIRSKYSNGPNLSIIEHQ